MTLKASNYPTIRPSLDLNFSQTKRLDPRITFSRTSTGTYFDANGVLQSAPAGVARFDHNPVSGESLGLLMEPARTNSKLYSQDFTNEWLLVASSILDTTQVAPDGSTTATTLGLPIPAARLQINSTAANSSPGTWTFSVWMRNVNPGTASITLLLQTTLGAFTGTVVTVTNQWQRFSTTQEVISGGGIQLRNDTANNYTIEVWGAQLEAGSYPTSYIPTTSSAATRAADVCTVTNSNIYDTDSFTIINQPFGASTNDGSTLTLFDGPEPIKRATVYSTDLSQTTVNAAAGKTDEFWRWRVLGSSFALPNFATDGQVTVDWGDGTIETLTTAEHTFSDGSGYHDIGFRLNSGTYFRPYVNNNASHDTKVVALGPAPESMKLNGERAFWGCSNLEAFDATVDATGGPNFDTAWRDCSSLTSFPLINTSAGTNFGSAWRDCTSLTSFPLIDTAAGTGFYAAWFNCNSLTSFPLINTAAGTNFTYAWYNCNSLTSFPLINTAAGTSFSNAWESCTSLTSFPLINTAAGTNFQSTWYNNNSLTSFPLINTAAGTNFSRAWESCSSLTSFPLIDTSSGTNFTNAWYGCSSLTSFPLIDTGAGTNFSSTWRDCTSLTSFPLIDTSAVTNFAVAWFNCTSLTSFPLIDTAAGTNFGNTWTGCSSLTSFPLINTAAVTNFAGAWESCSSLTSFPLIDTAAGTNFATAWFNCNSLTSFPLIDTAAGTNFSRAWHNCTGLTSFPLIDTAAGTNFSIAWFNCNSLTSFPLIDTSAGTNFSQAWPNCTSLTSFPLINTAAGTNFAGAWEGCTSLTDFPANFFDSWTGTPVANCFVNAWNLCPALTATSVENILNSIDTSGQSAPASGVNITIAYNAGTGTPSVATAITNLKSRGWTITLNGVLQ